MIGEIDMRATSQFEELLNFKWLGRVSYLEGLRAQEEHLNMTQTLKKGVVLGLEHDPVVTLSRRSGQSDLKVPESQLLARGFEVQCAARGGLATVHNPGQLVLYPLLPLRKWNLGVREYVQLVLRVTTSALRSWSVPCQADFEKNGVFTRRGKIGFVGIRIQKGLSSHGVSINVCNDLSPFSWIVSCGVQDAEVDKVVYYKNVPIKALAVTWHQHLTWQIHDICRGSKITVPLSPKHKDPSQPWSSP